MFDHAPQHFLDVLRVHAAQFEIASDGKYITGKGTAQFFAVVLAVNGFDPFFE
jgi:hypothetical protein